MLSAKSRHKARRGDYDGCPILDRQRQMLRRQGAPRVHDRTHLHGRRLHAAVAHHRLCARHRAGGRPRRRPGRRRVLRGAAAAQSFPRDLRRRRVQRGLRAGLCAHPRSRPAPIPRSCSPIASSRCCSSCQVVLLAVALIFTPAVISVLAPGFDDDPEPLRARGRADPHHVSLSAAGLAGDALRRHPQCARPLRGGRRGADPAQPLDDRGAGAGGLLSDRGPRGGLGRAHRRLPRSAAARRRRQPAGRAAGVPLAAARRGGRSSSSSGSGPPPSAPPKRRSRCSPTPSSRASSPPARCRRSITPTGSINCRSA